MKGQTLTGVVLILTFFGVSHFPLSLAQGTAQSQINGYKRASSNVNAKDTDAGSSGQTILEPTGLSDFSNSSTQMTPRPPRLRASMKCIQFGERVHLAIVCIVEEPLSENVTLFRHDDNNNDLCNEDICDYDTYHAPGVECPKTSFICTARDSHKGTRDSVKFTHQECQAFVASDEKCRGNHSQPPPSGTIIKTPLTADNLVHRVRAAISNRYGDNRTRQDDNDLRKAVQNGLIQVQKSTVQSLELDLAKLQLKTSENDEDAGFAILIVKLVRPKMTNKRVARRSNHSVNSYTVETSSTPSSNQSEKIIPSLCLLPSMEGPCRGYHRSWYFDQISQKCEEFVYGGCHGNANRFINEDDCTSVCGGGGLQNKRKNVTATTTTTPLPAEPTESQHPTIPPAKVKLDCTRQQQRSCSQLSCQFGVTMETAANQQQEQDGCPLCACKIDPCHNKICAAGLKCESSRQGSYASYLTVDPTVTWVARCVPATVYYKPDRSGQSEYNVYSGRSDKCKNLLNRVYGRVASVQTYGSCVQLYTGWSCTGSSTLVYPINGTSRINLNPRFPAQSIGPCP